METRIQSVMADILGIEASSISDDTSPRTVGAWDSLKHMTLLLALEEEFGVQFPDELLPELSSYAAICTELAKLGATA